MRASPSPLSIARTVLCLALALGGCTTGGTTPPGADGGGPLVGCNPGLDSDNDGISDDAESHEDTDGDGAPDFQDLDSDADGILDAVEHMGNIPCSLPDSDGDGTPNWRDADSDNDGLSDADEQGRYATNPYDIDSDGDGVTDLGEVLGSRTDPNDASSTIPEEDFFLVLPYNDPAQMRSLRFDTNLQLADVYFLIDTTGSMGDAIADVRSSLTRIAGEVRARIPNVELGVGEYRDFPAGDGGPLGMGYGSSGDLPYVNQQDITGDLARVQSALGRLSAGGGADTPESATEAIYQTATGAGAPRWTFTRGSVDLPRRQCNAVPDERGRRRGYPCFRPESLPIVVLVTDAPYHNGPSNSEPYTGISPPPASFDAAVEGLESIGARFIGVSVAGGPTAEMNEMAQRTGSVDLSGNVLVYSSGGGGVSDRIIEGIETLAGRTPQDVDGFPEDVPGNPDNFDARQFIKAITPVEGYNNGQMGAIPGVTYSSRNETAFFDVIPGTQVEFSVRFLNDVRMPPETAEIHRAVIVVRGNGVARLDTRNVYIIVPPSNSVILI